MKVFDYNGEELTIQTEDKKIHFKIQSTENDTWILKVEKSETIDNKSAAQICYFLEPNI